MSIFRANISLLNKFLDNFASCFTKKQFAMFILVVYAMFKDYKRNSLEAMAEAVHTDYQKFQYFFCDSKWDLPALKQKWTWGRILNIKHGWIEARNPTLTLVKYRKWLSLDFTLSYSTL